MPPESSYCFCAFNCKYLHLRCIQYHVNFMTLHASKQNSPIALRLLRTTEISDGCQNGDIFCSTSTSHALNYPQHLTALTLPGIIGKISCSLNSVIQRSMDRRWWCNKSGRLVTEGRRPRNACTIPSAQLALSINCSNPLTTQSSIFLSLNAVPSAVLTILPPGLTFRAWQMQLNSGNPRGRRVGKWDNALVGILLSHSHSPH